MAYKSISCLLFLGLWAGAALAQGSKNKEKGYIFKNTVEIPHSSVKNQQQTGTCWSFGTISFLEAEVLRIKKQSVDLSEMYAVRHIYTQKLRNYYLRQGKANFGEGSLAHDVFNVLKYEGVMPETAYNGNPNAGELDHSGLVAALEGLAKASMGNGKTQPWPVLNAWSEQTLKYYMGDLPLTFGYDNKSYRPQEWAESLGLRYDNYIYLTSFIHHPFYEPFVLEVPDNFSNGAYMNVKLEELLNSVNNALNKGYTVIWDGDTSEDGFAHEDGLAVLPLRADDELSFLDKPMPEMQVTQESRQRDFETLQTTDDHLMHIVGRATDQSGNNYYIVKNSWGSDERDNPYKGLLYMSEAYFKQKTVAVIFHKEGLEKDLAAKILKK